MGRLDFRRSSGDDLVQLSDFSEGIHMQTFGWRRDSIGLLRGAASGDDDSVGSKASARSTSLGDMGFGSSRLERCWNWTNYEIL